MDCRSQDESDPDEPVKAAHIDNSTQHYHDLVSCLRTGRIDEAENLVTLLNKDEAAAGLWYSSSYGRCTVIPLLVSKLEQYDTMENYLTSNRMVNQAISIAAERGMLKAVMMLVDIGASVETRNTDRMTTLHSAAMHNHAEVVDFCLQKGVKVDELDKLGNVALHYAAYHPSEATALVICHHNSTTDYLNTKNLAKFTPLDEAFRHCSLEVAEFLINRNASVSNVKKIMEKDQSQNGMTALHLAAKVGKVALVQFLCEKKAKLQGCDLLGNTALHMASRHNQPEIVGILVNAGIDLLARDEVGNTALDVARRHQFDVCADIIARATNHHLVSVYGVCDCEDITIGVGGAPGAGKTTFVRSFGRSYLRSLVTNESAADTEDKDEKSRTRGIRIERLKDPLGSPMVYHFLDFGGHQEYIPSHSLFISESTTPAMVVCLVNSNKSGEKLLEEMELWCGVFISCHRLQEGPPPEPVDTQETRDEMAISEDSEPGFVCIPTNVEDLKSIAPETPLTPERISERPHVDPLVGAGAGPKADKKETGSAAVAVTTADRRCPLKMPFVLVVTRHDLEEGRGQQVEAVLWAYAKIKEKFKHRLAFEESPVFLDARRSHAGGLMREVRGLIQKLSTHLLQHTAKTPQLIYAVRKVLPEVRRRFGRPFTTRDEFKEMLLDVLEKHDIGKELHKGVGSLIDPVLQLLSFCGELVVFSSYDIQHIVVLKADWLLTEIVGHLCSPRYFKGGQRITFNEEARADKRQVERVLSGLGGPGDIILMMIENIGICIIDDDEVVIPSKLPDRELIASQTQIGLWEKNPRQTTYSGVCYMCDEGLPMSPGVAPVLQTKCYKYFKKEHGTAPHLWRRGIRVQPFGSEVQGTICVSPSRLDVFIACRGPANTQRHQFALVQMLSKTVMEVVKSISPGSRLQKKLLSPNELQYLVDTRSSAYPSVFYDAEEAVGLMECGVKTIATEKAARLGITDNIIDLLFHLPDSHIHFLSPPTRTKLIQTLCTPTHRSTHYEAWVLLAERLGFEPSDIEHKRSRPNPVDEVLDEWGQGGINKSHQELSRLCRDIHYEASCVLEREIGKPFHGIPNVFTVQRQRYLNKKRLHQGSDGISSERFPMQQAAQHQDTSASAQGRSKAEDDAAKMSNAPCPSVQFGEVEVIPISPCRSSRHMDGCDEDGQSEEEEKDTENEDEEWPAMKHTQKNGSDHPEEAQRQHEEVVEVEVNAEDVEVNESGHHQNQSTPNDEIAPDVGKLAEAAGGSLVVQETAPPCFTAAAACTKGKADGGEVSDGDRQISCQVVAQATTDA